MALDLDRSLESEHDLLNRLFVDFASPEPYQALARHAASKWHETISADLETQLRSISQFHATLLLPPWSDTIMRRGFWSISRFVDAVEYAALNAKGNVGEPWRAIVERAALFVPEAINDLRAAQDESELRFSH